MGGDGRAVQQGMRRVQLSLPAQRKGGGGGGWGILSIERGKFIPVRLSPVRSTSLTQALSDMRD